MTNDSLEGAIKKEGRFRKSLADTVSAGTVALGICGLAMARDGIVYDFAPEYSLSLEQSAVTRGLMAAVVTGTGRLFGKYRDYMLSKFGDNNFLRRASAEISANASFYGPLQLATLCAMGADARQIGTACAVSLLVSALGAIPYGMYMDAMRSLFGSRA